MVIVDRGSLPIGASTRNAGFACFGSPTEILSDIKEMGETKTFKLVEKRWSGLKNLLQVCPKDEIDYEAIGGNEIFLKHDKTASREVLGKLDFLNKNLELISGVKNVYDVDEKQKRQFSEEVDLVIHNKLEGQLNVGKLVANLFSQLRSLDIEYYGGIDVKAIEENSNEVLVTTNNHQITANQLIVATNAFTNQFFPDIEITPQRNLVMITEPIEELKWKGNYHLDRGYFYFRNVGKRVLIGGGRHLFPKAEQTSEFGISENIQKELERLLSEVILDKTPYKIESSWSGILATSKEKSPIVKKVSDRIVLAVRLGGMGVAISNLVAEQAANLFEHAL